jgi:hypothetical protein
MHLAHRHLPRPLIITWLAALAAIVVSLALASQLNDLQLSQATSSPRPASSPLVIAPAARPAPAWLNPFAPIVTRPIHTPWPRSS